MVTFGREAVNGTCAQGLHSGIVAHCATRSTDLAPISVIDDGIVVVNDALVEVSVDDGPEVFVNGTYLVTFKRTAFINGTKYVNFNDYPKRLPQLATSARLNVTYHHALLSLPFLHKLSEKNLQRIYEQLLHQSLPP